eukprot:259983-Pelagomonas_calceolata.AAC.6
MLLAWDQVGFAPVAAAAAAADDDDDDDYFDDDCADADTDAVDAAAVAEGTPHRQQAIPSHSLAFFALLVDPSWMPWPRQAWLGLLRAAGWGLLASAT